MKHETSDDIEEVKRNNSIIEISSIYISKVSCGRSHVIMLGGSLCQSFVFGTGRFGELGLGVEVKHASSPTRLQLSNVVDVYAGPFHSMIVAVCNSELSSTIFTFGCGSYYRLVLFNSNLSSSV
mmetsp:Transcript_14595/g.20039  ORF Transcript_14595/g.20039 Transcript_14595/m.20039 type:complete len:124 (-) Transcript_14595:853-1224(-)